MVFYAVLIFSTLLVLLYFLGRLDLSFMEEEASEYWRRRKKGESMRKKKPWLMRRLLGKVVVEKGGVAVAIRKEPPVLKKNWRLPGRYD